MSNELDVGKETSSSDCEIDSSAFSSLDPNNHEKKPPKNDAINEKGFISILNKLPKKELGCSSVCAGSVEATGFTPLFCTSAPCPALVVGCPPLFCVGPVG